ncbi:MAG: RluA family pseudouridine synthase [Solirubrobacterales bacterium]
MTRRIELTVAEQSAGRRLDVVIGEHDEIATRSHAGKLIESGAVTVDGKPPRKSDLTVAGQVISIEFVEQLGDPSKPAVPFDIVYEDQWLMVVDKPAGLVVHPGPGNRSGTLSQALVGRAGGGDPQRPGIVHRLDKDTSGLLVVARDDATLRALQTALQAREVARQYTALVRGRPDSRAGTIDAPLGRDRRQPDQVGVRADSPREAITHFELEEELSSHSLLSVRLETGRTHQIRVHLAAIGLPVSGDETYGIAGDLCLTRQFLHASRLSFTHPTSKRPLEFTSKLPKDLREALERARGS